MTSITYPAINVFWEKGAAFPPMRYAYMICLYDHNRSFSVQFHLPYDDPPKVIDERCDYWLKNAKGVNERYIEEIKAACVRAWAEFIVEQTNL